MTPVVIDDRDLGCAALLLPLNQELRALQGVTPSRSECDWPSGHDPIG
jgi:hypothetical protein